MSVRVRRLGTVFLFNWLTLHVVLEISGKNELYVFWRRREDEVGPEKPKVKDGSPFFGQVIQHVGYAITQVFSLELC